MEKTVLIAGATGVAGQAALEHFASLPDWQVLAVSRRVPEVPPTGRWRHLALDLSDPQACRDALSGLSGVTHIVYGALLERAALREGWNDRAQMDANLAMLRNLTDPLRGKAPVHLSLLQGGKAYGMHLHPIAVPAKESWPRDPHENFYWLQEDHVRALAAQDGWAFTILRPQIIFGGATGAAMNLVPVIGAYAALVREEGLPFSFPGGVASISEAVDARLLARAFAWAAEAEAAHGETFNLTNGDVFSWRSLWPSLATMFGLEPGPERSFSMAEFLGSRAETWRRLAAREGLGIADLPSLVGYSHHYADICFGVGRTVAPAPALVSTIKVRQAGFGDCVDTAEMFAFWFAEMRRRRVLPA